MDLIVRDLPVVGPINRGMSDVLDLLAGEITKQIGTLYRDYDATDLALGTGRSPTTRSA
jgi:hypothetical protein